MMAGIAGMFDCCSRWISVFIRIVLVVESESTNG